LFGPGIKGTTENKTVRVFGFDSVILAVRVKPIEVKLIEISRVEDPHVDVAIEEQIVDHCLLAILTKFLKRPGDFRRTQSTVIGIETFNPALAVLVPPVGRARIPQVRVSINDEDVLALVDVHRLLLLGSPRPLADTGLTHGQ